MNVPGIRAALRIARRDALRAKGRSALVVAMIGIPMLGVAFADVSYRTHQLPPAIRAERELGAADLRADFVADGPISQDGLDGYSSQAAPATIGTATPPDPDLAAALPRGSRITARHTHYGARVRSSANRLTLADVDEVDLSDPMSRGIARLVKGAFPTGKHDAAITPHLARTLSIGPGSVVSIEEYDHPIHVTGVVVMPSELHVDRVFVRADDLPRDLGFVDAGERRWGITLPPGTRDVDVVPALNAIGLRALPRTWYFDPPPRSGTSGDNAEAIGLAVVVVGLATLEVVLLAGTAFAVGARRQRRELALVAATGGDRRDVRRVVLAGGVVLGAVAGAVAVAGGVLAVFLGRPLLDRLGGSELGPLDLRPLELAAVVLVGAGTALVAALLPANTAARQSVVAALGGRRGEVRTRRRVPVIAFVAIVAGVVLAFWAAGAKPENQIAVETINGVPYTSSGRPANFSLLLAGAVIAELGFVALAPSLVALVGRLARRLPLSLRLAARDASRHRTRSGPAVAAVAAAVAGSVAVSVYLASDTERQRREYRPSYAKGVVAINRPVEEPYTVSDADVDKAVAKLPVRSRLDVTEVTSGCRVGFDCAAWTATVPPDNACRPEVDACDLAGPIAVGGPDVAAWVMQREDPAVADALRRNVAVVFGERLLGRSGQVTLVEEQYTATGGGATGATVSVPAIEVRAPHFDGSPAMLLPPALARAKHLPTSVTKTILTTTRMPTEGEEAAARGAATSKQGTVLDLYVERGFRQQNPFVLLVLALGSAVVTLGATAIATGLAAADSRPDLATLAAVGAAPRVRRRLAMAQAATVAAIGGGLGILAGLVPAIAVVAARTDYPLDLPWQSIAMTAFGVPVLAALVIGAFTRSRLPLERRIA